MHPVTASISVQFGKQKKTLVSPNVQRVISVSLTILEIFTWIVDPPHITSVQYCGGCSVQWEDSFSTVEGIQYIGG